MNKIPAKLIGWVMETFDEARTENRELTTNEVLECASLLDSAGQRLRTTELKKKERVRRAKEKGKGKGKGK